MSVLPNLTANSSCVAKFASYTAASTENMDNFYWANQIIRTTVDTQLKALSPITIVNRSINCISTVTTVFLPELSDSQTLKKYIKLNYMQQLSLLFKWKYYSALQLIDGQMDGQTNEWISHLLIDDFQSLVFQMNLQPLSCSWWRINQEGTQCALKTQVIETKLFSCIYIPVHTQ